MKNKKRWIFGSLLLLVLILGGVLSFYMPFTNDRNERIWFLYWILHDPKNFFALAESESIFWCIYGVVLICAIFLFGKSLHEPRELDKAAILKDNDPYFIVKEIYDNLNAKSNFQEDKEKGKILYSLKVLKEKLLVERDFGRGHIKIIEYENKIAYKLIQLRDLALNHELQEKDWSELQQLIYAIDKMLERRNEWKKEHN